MVTDPHPPQESYDTGDKITLLVQVRQSNAIWHGNSSPIAGFQERACLNGCLMLAVCWGPGALTVSACEHPH